MHVGEWNEYVACMHMKFYWARDDIQWARFQVHCSSKLNVLDHFHILHMQMLIVWRFIIVCYERVARKTRD